MNETDTMPTPISQQLMAMTKYLGRPSHIQIAKLSDEVLGLERTSATLTGERDDLKKAVNQAAMVNGMLVKRAETAEAAAARAREALHNAMVWVNFYGDDIADAMRKEAAEVFALASQETGK